MKIYRKEQKLIAEIDLVGNRSNPWDEDYRPEYCCIGGLIIRHSGYDEVGFCHLSDMDYKGKPDQACDFILMWDKGEESFRKLCEVLNLPMHELDLRK